MSPIRSGLFALSIAAAFATYAGGASAGTIVDSDRMVITDLTTGTVLFDATTAEGAAGEASLFFGAPTPLPPPPDTMVVILTEPAGEPPGENPIFLPGTNEIISDLVFSTLAHPAVGGVLLVSDGDPLFTQWLSAALGLQFVAVPETGQLQDLSPLLGGDHSQLRVEVQSDVIPEPGTLLLVGSGLLAIAAAGRRARRRQRA